MPICWFPARAAAFLMPKQMQHPLCLAVLLAGLFTCHSIRTSSTLHAPTHYTRSRPCVLDTPQKNTCHGSNRVPVHARFLPTLLPQPSKILPKSSCLASRGTSLWSASVDSDILGMLNAPLSFQPLELDFQTPNLDNPARIHVTLPLPQPLDDNINSIRTPPLLKPILSALSPQTMTGDKTIAPEINIANNWHIIPTSGDLLANDTNDLAHFLSLHPFGSWPPKAPPRSNLQVTSFLMTFLVTLTGCGVISSIIFLVSVAVLNVFLYIHLCSTYFSLAFIMNKVYVSSSATAFVISALAVISYDSATFPCAPRYLHSTHFPLLRTLYGLSMFSIASFSVSSPAIVLSLGSAGRTFCVFDSLRLPCCPLVYALDAVPMFSSASFLDRHLVTVNSLDCVGEKIFLTMRFDSGYTPDFSPCSLYGSKVSPLLSVPVLCLSRSYNTDDQPVLLHWTVCLSLLQQILAHQNFPRVCTTYFLRHFRASPGRLRLLRQSNSGRKRLNTLNLELIQHHPFIETRTSPHTQPLSSFPPDSNTRPLASNPSRQPQIQSGLLRRSSLPASALGKRPIPVSSNVDSKKNKKQNRPLPPPLLDLFTVLLSTFVV